jgi:D-alanyl-D-alanine carboxypeptidase
MTFLLNPQHKTLLRELGIPKNYGSEPLLPVYAEAGELVEAGPNIVGRMQSLTPATAAAWLGMLEEARQEQIELVMVSGFRSMEYQASLIRKKLDAGQTIKEILQVNVAPGFSQHHTGNAIDIATPGYKPLLEEFAESPAFAWLTEHAGRFGFTMSYPRDNPEGVAYEPWHWYRAEV